MKALPAFIIGFALLLSACKQTPPAPRPSPYHLPTSEITNGVTLVIYQQGVPSPAPAALSNQLALAGAVLNLTNATEWIFSVVDTPAKRAAIDAALAQGAHFKPQPRP